MSRRDRSRLRMLRNRAAAGSKPRIVLPDGLALSAATGTALQAHADSMTGPLLQETHRPYGTHLTGALAGTRLLRRPAAHEPADANETARPHMSQLDGILSAPSRALC